MDLTRNPTPWLSHGAQPGATPLLQASEVLVWGLLRLLWLGMKGRPWSSPWRRGVLGGCDAVESEAWLSRGHVGEGDSGQRGSCEADGAERCGYTQALRFLNRLFLFFPLFLFLLPSSGWTNSTYTYAKIGIWQKSPSLLRATCLSICRQPPSQHLCIIIIIFHFVLFKSFLTGGGAHGYSNCLASTRILVWPLALKNNSMHSLSLSLPPHKQEYIIYTIPFDLPLKIHFRHFHVIYLIYTYIFYLYTHINLLYFLPGII